MGSIPKLSQQEDMIKVVENTTGYNDCGTGGRTSTGGENEPVAEDAAEALMILEKVRAGDQKENFSQKKSRQAFLGGHLRFRLLGTEP